MSRESSYNSAGNACSKLQTAISELRTARDLVNNRIGYIEYYWTGESGSAMTEALNNWVRNVGVIIQRADAVLSDMRESQEYDYSLWLREKKK